MSPKFSIIIPVYNVAPYLRECLHSVVAAAEEVGRMAWGVEVVCVDDGSTDGSSEILEGFSRQSSPSPALFTSKILHQQNLGVAAARNRGLEEASGEWVWFVDGDDMIHPNSLRVIASHIQKSPTADLIKIANFFGETIPSVWGQDEVGAPLLMTKKDLQLLNAFDGASKFIIRRAVTEGVVFEPYRWLEDILFVVRCIGNGRDLLLTSDILYFYRKRLGSAIHSKRTMEQVAEIFRATKRLIDAARAVASQHPTADYSLYWKRLHALAFFSFRYEYFGLRTRERTELLPNWLALQSEFRGLYNVPREWRMRIAFVKLFRSGFLVKPLVLWGHRWRGRVSGLISWAKGVVR